MSNVNAAVAATAFSSPRTEEEMSSLSLGNERYGTIPTQFKKIEHASNTIIDWTSLAQENKSNPESLIGRKVLLRGRLHTSRGTSKNSFLVIRNGFNAMQAVLFVGDLVSKDMIKFASNISRESIVDVGGEIVSSVVKSDLCSFKNCELRCDFIYQISPSISRLPFQIDDASRPDDEKTVLFDDAEEDGEEERGEQSNTTLTESDPTALPTVGMNIRLNNRVLDLRTAANQSIFRLQSHVVQLAREILYENDFIEIHSPKLISCASEGGSNVFKVDYFKKSAFLAQSPQFYKQMAICADFPKIFEIGPVFRAENSFTHRHMTEFTGLDMEMAFKEDYHEALYVICDVVLQYVFKNLPLRYGNLCDEVRKQHPSASFVSLPQFGNFKDGTPVPLDRTLILSFVDGIQMLREDSQEIGDYDDLSTEKERRLGQLVKEKYGTDFYVLDKYPLAVRPFYTMPDKFNPGYSNSYDVFMRGEEIMSGAQRVNDHSLLQERAKVLGIEEESIKGYLDSFRWGAPPHAGGGIGLERVLMLYFALGNIRKTSLFPRDPRRISP